VKSHNIYRRMLYWDCKVTQTVHKGYRLPADFLYSVPLLNVNDNLPCTHSHPPEAPCQTIPLLQTSISTPKTWTPQPYIPLLQPRLKDRAWPRQSLSRTCRRLAFGHSNVVATTFQAPMAFCYFAFFRMMFRGSQHAIQPPERVLRRCGDRTECGAWFSAALRCRDPVRAYNTFLSPNVGVVRVRSFFGIEIRCFSSCLREVLFLFLFILRHQRLLLAFQLDSACCEEPVLCR
jgi:hypothetical protein